MFHPTCDLGMKVKIDLIIQINVTESHKPNLIDVFEYHSKEFYFSVLVFPVAYFMRGYWTNIEIAVV